MRLGFLIDARTERINTKRARNYIEFFRLESLLQSLGILVGLAGGALFFQMILVWSSIGKAGTIIGILFSWLL